MFFRWRKLAPDWLGVTPIQLPGRETRRAEVPYAIIDELVQDAADVLEPITNQPYALVGNSMGALVALELAREMRRRKLPMPKLSVVAACRAPQLIEPTTNPLTELADEEFVAEINKRYGGIPAEIAQDQELMQLFLPVLRADVSMLEYYRYRPNPPLDVEILALGGSEDSSLSIADINGWQEQTTGKFSSRRLPGDHFFLSQFTGNTLPAALRMIIDKLDQYQ